MDCNVQHGDERERFFEKEPSLNWRNSLTVVNVKRVVKDNLNWAGFLLCCVMLISRDSDK